MTTAFVSLAGAIKTALSAAPAVADGRVYLNRLAPVAAAHNTAVAVRLVQTTGREVALGAHDWASEIDVECYARAATGADPAAAVDALLETVWSRLVGINAASLGAMAVQLNPTVTWQFDDAGETPVACATVRLQVRHRTAVTSLTAWP